MKRMTFASLVLALLPAQAGAYQNFIEHRIRGEEIRSVRIVEPEAEDPFMLVIETDPDFTGTGEIVIESDSELEACREAVESAIGKRGTYVQIIVQTTAQTMNGTLATECVVLSD